MVVVFVHHLYDVHYHLRLRKDSSRRFTPEAKGKVLPSYLCIGGYIASTNAFDFLLRRFNFFQDFKWNWLLTLSESLVTLLVKDLSATGEEGQEVRIGEGFSKGSNFCFNS